MNGVEKKGTTRYPSAMSDISLAIEPELDTPQQDQKAAFQASAGYTQAEDIYGIFIAALLIAIGMSLLHSAGLVTGGNVGIALLLSMYFPLPSGLLFLMLNLPFFLLGWRMMGTRFTVKSLTVTIVTFALSHWLPDLFAIARIDPLLASVAGGTIVGMGALAAARHGAGAGGTLILVLTLQKRLGLNAGAVQLAIDFAILTASASTLTAPALFWSLASVLAQDAMIIVWHRPARANEQPVALS